MLFCVVSLVLPQDDRQVAQDISNSLLMEPCQSKGVKGRFPSCSFCSRLADGCQAFEVVN